MTNNLDYVTRQHIQMLLANDEFEKTLKFINKIVQKNPEEYCKWEYFRFVVKADIELKQLKHAHSICTVRRTSPANPLELVWEDFGDIDSAIAENSKNTKYWYERALNCYLNSYSIDKNNVIVYKKIATMYENLEDYKKAIEWLTKAIKRDKSYILAYYQKSRILERCKKYKEAIETLYDLKQVYPQEEIFYSTGEILKSKKDYKKAINEFEKGVDDDDYGHCHLEIAKCYEKLKDYKNVLKTYKKMFKNCPKNPKEWILQLIGEFYGRIKDLDNAQITFNKILHTRNNEYSEYYKGIAYYNLMMIYYNKKLYKKSLNCALKAKKLYTKQAKENSGWGLEVLNEIVDIYVYLGNCYYEMNQNHLASIKAYKKILYFIPYFEKEYLIEWGKNNVHKIYNFIAIQYLALNKIKLVEYYLGLEENKQKELPEYYMVKAELAYRNNNLKEMKKYWKTAQKISKNPDDIPEEAKLRLSFLKTVI